MSRRSASAPRRSKSAPMAAAARVAGHRVRLTQAGRKRVEVVVPARDIALIKQLAERLRASPADAARARSLLVAAVAQPQARTGAALIDLLRGIPSGGIELDLKRDRTPLRNVDLSA